MFFEFLVAGLLRGDSKARSEYYKSLFNVGSLSPNDILSKENMNPVDGGDQRFVPLNMVPLDQAGQVQQQDAPAVSNDENRSIEHRSITTRDRVAKRYLPLFTDAAQTVVNKESRIVKKLVKKRASSKIEAAFEDMPEYITKKMGG